MEQESPSVVVSSRPVLGQDGEPEPVTRFRIRIRESEILLDSQTSNRDRASRFITSSIEGAVGEATALGHWLYLAG